MPNTLADKFGPADPLCPIGELQVVYDDGTAVLSRQRYADGWIYEHSLLIGACPAEHMGHMEDAETAEHLSIGRVLYACQEDGLNFVIYWVPVGILEAVKGLRIAA
ncbi:hypothetical protein GCM10022419_015970 [Nonomuraea rosea]|uniref:Rieske domain-containing protein n=1 Tax=Nonomuraea rosea TaxID=638574 RepID=A0ABP6VN13_9ACTN